MFLACESQEHCGHFKDRKGAVYDPAQLIKPDEDDPQHYLYFHSSGEVRARAGLTGDEVVRANETIRVFGLADRSLAGARAKAVFFYKDQVASELDEVASWPAEDRRAYLEQEVERTRYDPYASTIRDFLQKAA